jgi:hypothetical protein
MYGLSGCAMKDLFGATISFVLTGRHDSREANQPSHPLVEIEGWEALTLEKGEAIQAISISSVTFFDFHLELDGH